MDEREALLTVAGQGVDLDRSSYDVLLCLLRHAGEVVGKDELLEAGWPARVVSENSLAKAVSRIRHALGADGGSLKVVHGYGYRLAVGVHFETVPLAKVHAHPHEADRLRPGDPLPQRPGWSLRRRLGEGSAGLIYLAQDSSGQACAVKLATGEAGLRSLKREIALERYMAAAAADIPGLARLTGWNLAHPPFFAEMPFFEQGNLRNWIDARGGWAGIDLDARLQMCAGLCDTLAALHGLGIIHKDLKPENLYPLEPATPGGTWRLMLSDLGAGQAAITPRLAELDMGLSIIDPVHGITSGQAGNLLYMAPEVIAGEIPTQRSDVFSLGVLLYQLVVGDLRRSLAPGWELEVTDPLLREDIAAAAASDPHRRLLDPAELADRLRGLEARRHAQERQRAREQAILRTAKQLATMKRRRRRGLAAVSVLLSVLALSLWQQQATRREREIALGATSRAQAEAAKTAAVVDFLTDGILRQANPYEVGSRPLSLRHAIDRAAHDVKGRFSDEPAIAAEIHGALAGAYEGMNEFGSAVGHYDKQVRALRRTRPVDLPAVARAQSALCRAWHWQGSLPWADAACLRARADFLAAGLPPDMAEVFLALSDSRRDENRRVLHRLSPRMERIRSSGDDDLLGYALWFTGIAQNRVGDVQASERTHAELVAVRQRQAPGGSMSLAWALADHGRALLQAGRIDEGERTLARAQAMFDRIAGPENPQGRTPAIHRARHAYALGQWTRARALARPQYEFLRQAAGWQNWTIFAALTTVAAEARLGNQDAARELLAELAAGTAGLERDFPYLRETYWTHLFDTHLALGDTVAAQTYLEKLAALSRHPDASALLPAQVECHRGALRAARSQATRARRHLDACRRGLESLLPKGSPLLQLPRHVVVAADASRA
ncbi:hypothetical protein GCM10023332_04890 [Luteimonas vadosa]|uniref:Non-specific serine/threonine protein kinase n=1 Tax=Luteimonas vadosa TaxID=1165507 RepID=A0ABP9DS27_9GAMM